MNKSTHRRSADFRSKSIVVVQYERTATRVSASGWGKSGNTVVTPVI